MVVKSIIYKRMVKKALDYKTEFAVVIGLVGSFISFLVDGLGIFLVVLLGMMVIDYLTGLMSAISQGKLNVSLGLRGIIKKVYIILLIGATYMISVAIPSLEYVGDGVTIAFVVMEFISIVENGVKLNVYMPKLLSNIILIAKEKVGETNDTK